MKYKKPEIELIAEVLTAALASSDQVVSGIGNEGFTENGELLDIDF